MNRIAKYRGLSGGSFKTNCERIRAFLEDFASDRGLAAWYGYWEKFYKLPASAAGQELKYYISDSYNYQEGKFSDKFEKRRGLISLIKYIGFLVYTLFCSVRYKKVSQHRYDLIIDWIESRTEADRFFPLTKEVKNSVIIFRNPVDWENSASFYFPDLKRYQRSLVLKTVGRELTVGLLINLYVMFKTGVNIFPLSVRVLNRYMYYQTIFSQVKSRYLIQERNYETSAVKNHLFKMNGGVACSTIQKSCVQVGRNGFFHDIDIFFTVGKQSGTRALDFGSNIREIVPVGSMFLNRHLVSGGKAPLRGKNKFHDLVCFGANVSGQLNGYREFYSDYYEHIDWLRRLSLSYPDLKIAVKHHPNYRGDPKEEKILEGTSVEFTEPSENSYDVGMQARCCVTFCSIICYEFISLGIPVIFLDPNRRNFGLLDDRAVMDPLRATSYQEFEKHVLDVLSPDESNRPVIDPDDFCLDSHFVYRKISERFLMQ